MNPILQSLRQGVRRARLRRAAPRPTSYPNSSAATGAHRNSPNDDTQYTRFVATLLTVAELGLRPCEELGWNDIKLPLPDGLRTRRHPNCDTARQSLYLCRFCPTLLTTVPANRLPGRVTHSRFAGMLPKYLRAGHLRDADFYSPGSLRPGCASVAAEQHVDPPTIRRHPRWSEGIPSMYTDTPAADIPAVNRAIRQAYQHAPSSDTDSALYTNYDANATLATTRPCSRELVPPPHLTARLHLPRSI